MTALVIHAAIYGAIKAIIAALTAALAGPLQACSAATASIISSAGCPIFKDRLPALTLET